MNAPVLSPGRRCAECGAWSSVLFDLGGRIRVCRRCYVSGPPKPPAPRQIEIPEQFR